MTNNHQNIYADYNDDIQNETFNFRQQLHNIQLQRYWFIHLFIISPYFVIP